MSEPDLTQLKSDLFSVKFGIVDLVHNLRKLLHQIEVITEAKPSRFWLSAKELFDDTPVSELGVSVRILNCLKNEGLETVGDVVSTSDMAFLRTPNFGKKSLEELRTAIRAHRQKHDGETSSPHANLDDEISPERGTP